MRRPPRSLTVLALLFAVPLALAEDDGVELTYLGNEGLLIAAGETRVLVDALSGEGLRGYPAVPQEDPP